MSSAAGIIWLAGFFTFLAALMLVLRHLAALHLTKSQREQIEKASGAMFDQQQGEIRELARALDDQSAKLSQLGNRVGR